MQNSIDQPISIEQTKSLLEKITEKQWWQGSVIPDRSLPPLQQEHADVQWWVIVSQACNLYNHCFQNVPVFELLAACAININACKSEDFRGDNPRSLCVKVHGDDSIILKLDIQKRRWLPRKLLADLDAPRLYVRNAERDANPEWQKNQWLDNFAGWLARSYTRVSNSRPEK